MWSMIMATVTTRIRPFDLGEAHRRVRHPLERLRGYIRLYVALEGLALFCTFFAVWYWFSLMMDYGFFKVFGLDWVQESPRWARGLALGAFFSATVTLVQFPTLIPSLGRELRQGFHEAFALTPRQLVPFRLRLAVGVLAIGMVGGLAYLAGTEEVGGGLQALWVAVPLVAIGVLSVLYLRKEPGLDRAAKELPPLMWLRAALGAIGLTFGVVFGIIVARGMIGESVLAATLGAAVGAAILGTVAWHFASMLYLLVVEKQYRVLAGLPALLFYLIAWMLVGVGADEGLYGGAVTGFLLALLLLGPALFLAAKRLFLDFRHDALALVLERRFPNILGDRLITAVELADPREAAMLGYSPAMVEETIHEAAQRVEKLPLQEVFDWRRLIRQGLVVLILTLGGYLLAGGAFAAADAFTDEGAGLASFGRFHDVSAIWAERNLLLENTIWPRRAHLEFLDPFAEVDEFKVGRDNAAPTIKVRALKWVIADRSAKEGWRSMYWNDLNEELLGEAPPSMAVPADWAVRDPERGPSIDEIEIRLSKPETHKVIDPDTTVALRDVLAKLEERSKMPRLSRTFRMLTIPDTVYVNYWGSNTRSEMTLKQLNDNEYEGTFPDLKDSITLRARGEDYYTPSKRIIVVPPPSLVGLSVDEYQPAYLYYRATPEHLRGKKQLRINPTVSLFGGDVSRIDVPAGSDVVLHATTDKELQPGAIRVLSMDTKKPLDKEIEASMNKDGQFKHFQTRFDDVRQEMKLVFEFMDTDNVVGRRQVAIKPQEDLPPDLQVMVEVMRKTPQGYMVTPMAQIPFSGMVRDDRGLATIEFAYVLTRADPAGMGGQPVALMVGVMNPLAAACLSPLARPQKTEGDGKGKVEFPYFRERVNRPSERLPWEEIEKRLDHDFTRDDMPRPLLKDFKFDADDPDVWFDLYPTLSGERYPLRGKLPHNLKAPEGQRQPRYRLQLWLEATDTDIVNGPHRGQSAERFNFIVVSEEELLSEIAKEEESHHVKLEQAVARLRESEAKLTQMKLDMAVKEGLKKDQFGPMSLRTEEIEQTLEKTQTAVTEVFNDYERILKELRANRVQTVNYVKNIEDNIVGKLRDAIDSDFPEADKAVKELHRVLDADEADLKKKTTDAQKAADAAGVQLAKLIKRLDDVLASMEKLTTINKLIAILLHIQEALGVEDSQYRNTKLELEKELFKDLEAVPDAKDKKPPEKKK
jgi:hypothetical protein